MANLDQPQGFRPKGAILRIQEYTSGAEVFPGDLVLLNSSGLIVPAGATPAAVIGVAQVYVSATGKKILVSDHPDQMYVVQADDIGSSGIEVQTGMGLNYDLLPTAGNAQFKTSRQELDSSTGAVTATLPLRAIALDGDRKNSFGNNEDVIVMINCNQLTNGNVGAVGL